MKAAPFRYIRPVGLQHALQLLADGRLADDTKPMGGSQSLGPMLNLRLTRPRTVVDVSALPEMREVTRVSGMLRIGGSITHAEIEDGVFEALRGGLLQQVAGGIAYRAVRNRGTLAGSIAHADPAADWVLAMTALAARLELVSSTGRRTVPMEGFMRGAYTTALEPGELIAAIHIVPPSDDARWGYAKFCRKPGEFAEASCCAVFDAERRFARIVIGALDGAPRSLPELAATVASSGALPPREVLDRAIAAAAPGKDALDRKLIATTVRRCLGQALNLEAATA